MADKDAAQSFDEFAESFAAKLELEDTESTTSATTTTADQDDEELDGDPESPDGESDGEGEELEGDEQDDTEGETEGKDDASDKEPAPFTDKQLQAAAARHGIPLDLADIPEAARPLIVQRLKQMDKGLTKAFQEAATFRTEKAKHEAEARFRRENPVQAILELIDADPEILEKLNEQLETADDTPAYKEVQALERTKARAKAAEAIQAEEQAAEQRQARITHVSQLVSKTSSAHGIPAELVEDAVVALILERRAAGSDVTDAEVKAIIKSKAEVYKKATGKASKQEYTRDKARDARTASPRGAKPGTGSTPTPARRAPQPASLEEEMTATVDRIFGGGD